MSLYKNKYRVESARMSVWNYGLPASYFVTICTRDRVNHFGQIENETIILNKAGSIVQEEWLRTPIIREDMNVSLAEFVVMPNHFHGIIRIGKNKYNSSGVHEIYNPLNPDEHKKFGAQSKNLGSIIRGFKSAVSRNIKLLEPDFGWQDRYHDQVITNDEHYLNLKYYILNNPRSWKDDKFYKA